VSSSSPPSVQQQQNLLVPGQERWPLDFEKPVIELVDVSIGFAGNQVLKGLSLKILPGISTVIVGRSGSGKSVLLKLMMGLLQPDSGKVLLFGRDLATVSQVEMLELRKRMGMLFQNYALFDSMPVDENVGFTLLENSKMPRKDIMVMVQDLIRLLQLTGSEQLLPSSLSGGMKKRVGLGRALIARPEVVLFDEPTTGLDPIMIENVDEMILLAKKEFQITSVIISHDMASTRRLSDRVAFLHDGKIAFYGTYAEMAKSDFPPIRTFMEGAQTSRLSRDDVAEAVTAVEKDAPAAAASEPPVVELVGVSKSFGKKQVLRGVSLPIPKGLISVLIGGSGSGKSVIIKHILGLFRPDEGQIRVFGEELGGLDTAGLHGIRKRIGFLFQHAALLDWLSVAENVAFPLVEQTKMSKKEIKDSVSELLERLHIAELANRMPGEISVGQRKRVGLARAIIAKPEIMIYDEPTTGQDPIRTREVDDMIQETQREFDMTSIVISHDMASTFRIADRIALLHEGRIAVYGTPAEVRASQDDYVQHFIHAGSVGHRESAAASEDEKE
jgi:ABC-type transporter Mla maintaining outer membrane lipid asymmetry ATPase subunit MlaF